MSELALSSPCPAPKKRGPHRATRPQLLTRDFIDGRTNAAKVFDRLVSNIETDLGGRDQLSAIELALVEAFAGAAVTLENLNTRLLLGEEIEDRKSVVLGKERRGGGGRYKCKTRVE